MELNIKYSDVRCAIIYVLYNPDFSLLGDSVNISKTQVEKVYLIDNSDISSNDINEIVNDDRISYTRFNKNKGIAYALNYGCQKAINEGFNWVITFDQDSIPPKNLVETYSSFLVNMNSIEDIGILTLLISNNYQEVKRENSFKEVHSAITSGSFTSLSAFSKIGGFKDLMFIDAVDHEFSLNLRVHNFNIIRLNNIMLMHKFGDEDKILKIFNKYICGIHKRNHVRYYYMVRNYFYVIREYSKFDSILCKELKKELFKTLIKMLILEDNKIKKIHSSIRGFIDYKRNKLGKYRY